MKITFISNFLNHHQLPLAQEFDRICNGEYTFIALQPTSPERLNMGYESMNDKYPFVLKAYESPENELLAEKILLDSDVVICGAAPDSYIMPRLKSGKLTFKYMERLYRKESFLKTSYRYIRAKFTYGKLKKYPLYILCAGAHMAEDMSRSPAFNNRLFKWGYFPKCLEYTDVKEIADDKKENSLMWCGRFLDWKHPEIAIKVAKYLKDQDIDFSLKMIGTGPLFNSIQKMIDNYNLSDRVNLLDAVPTTEIRRNMEQAGIYLFTSDNGEGWGAVQNEAMNSCCAMVSNNEIGSTPFLLKHNDNGLICNNNNIEEFCSYVKMLLDDPNEQKRLGLKAYNTIKDQWNAQNAAKRFIKVVETINNGQDATLLFEDGVCSKA